MLAEFTETTDVPLEVSVDGGDLAIKVTASRKKMKVGDTVTFSARIAAGGAPNTTYTYTWEYGEGPVEGTAGHRHRQGPGDPVRAGRGPRQRHDLHDPLRRHRADPGRGRRRARAAPEPDGGRCERHARRRGLVGRDRRRRIRRQRQRRRQRHEHGHRRRPDATATPEPKPEPKPPPPPPKPFGETISGLLINDTGATVEKLPGGKPAGGAEGTRAVRGGETPGAFPLGMSGLLALLVMWVGALRERRGVRLRVA